MTAFEGNCPACHTPLSEDNDEGLVTHMGVTKHLLCDYAQRGQRIEELEAALRLTEERASERDAFQKGFQDLDARVEELEAALASLWDGARTVGIGAIVVDQSLWREAMEALHKSEKR